MGIAVSLKAGFAAIPAVAPVMVPLADLPDITTDDSALMFAEWRATPNLILRRSNTKGTPGRPVCLPVGCRPDIDALTGYQRARNLLAQRGERLRLIA